MIAIAALLLRGLQATTQRRPSNVCGDAALAARDDAMMTSYTCAKISALRVLSDSLSGLCNKHTWNGNSILILIEFMKEGRTLPDAYSFLLQRALHLCTPLRFLCAKGAI